MPELLVTLSTVQSNDTAKGARKHDHYPNLENHCE
jgi:hypothetical protein